MTNKVVYLSVVLNTNQHLERGDQYNYFFQHSEIWEAASGNEKGREKVAEFCFWFLADVL